MGGNAFIGGIKPGGLTNDFEVKILICYLLDNVSEELTFDQINETIQNTGFVNYFEFSEAMSELKESQHIVTTNLEDKTEVYCITDIGIATSRTFSKTLPLTVREQTIQMAKSVIQHDKRREQINIKYERVADGYNFFIRFKDIGTDLLNMNLFVPTEKQCEMIKERIYDNPAILYSGILSILTGDYDALIKLSNEQIEKNRLDNI